MNNIKKYVMSAGSLLIALILVFTMTVPAFAAGAYDDAEVTILTGETNGWQNASTKITYQIKLFGNGAKDGKITVKYLVNDKAVSTKTIAFDDFTKKSDGTYIYKDTYTASKTGTLQIYIKDLLAPTYENTRTFKFKIDTVIPTVNITKIASNVGVLKSTLLSIQAIDDNGIDSISINGTTVADKDDTNGNKVYYTTYHVYKDGTYVVAVNDIAGNQALSTVTVANGETTSTTVPTYPTIGSGTNTGISSTLLMELYNSNPMLYYYIINNGSISDSNLIGNNLWYYILSSQNSTTDSSLLYYLLLNGGLNGSGAIDPSFSVSDNSSLLYYYLMLNGGIGTGTGTGTSITNDQLVNQLYYYMLMNGNNAGDENLSFFYYYLFNNTDGKADNSWLLYYLLMNGEITPEIYAGLLGNSSSFLPNNYYTLALQYVNGSSITNVTKDGKLSMTAPKVYNNKYVNYKWQKAVDGYWKTVVGATSETLTVDPLVGDKYRVVISSDYSYEKKTSSTLTVTTDMLINDPVDDKDDDDDDDDDDDFTADDIVINGIRGNTVRLKKGASMVLSPNYTTGFWSFDSSYLSGNASPITVLKALKTGYTYISYTAFDSDGETATKFILVEIVD